VTLLEAANESELAGLRRLPARTITVLGDADAAARQRHFAALHGSRALTGPAAAIAQGLDDFHDAAANGDEDRYFALLPDDAVFLGTDASERWTGAEFRRFALPYFQRPEAWTYVPLQRHVTVLADGEHACFDELLDNDGYGLCRGSGVLVRRDGRWVLQLYDLSIPMPNDLAAAFAQRIRAFTDGLPSTATTVILVRHAEKGAEGDDPALSEAGRLRAEALVRTLRDVPIDAVWHSEYQRTALTVAPLCAARGLQPTVAKAADSAALARTLKRLPAGQTVLVCGHSNTLPALVAALGGGEVKVADDAFDGLFVVTRSPDGVRVLRLAYGP
jgi:phosphohistidine phosphatase SixA